MCTVLSAVKEVEEASLSLSSNSWILRKNEKTRIGKVWEVSYLARSKERWNAGTRLVSSCCVSCVFTDLHVGSCLVT